MNSSRLVDDEGTLARVSCGNSRVRALGFASLHSLCVNIQFPRPAWRDAGRKELSAVEISVGGLGSALGLGATTRGYQVPLTAYLAKRDPSHIFTRAHLWSRNLYSAHFAGMTSTSN